MIPHPGTLVCKRQGSTGVNIRQDSRRLFIAVPGRGGSAQCVSLRVQTSIKEIEPSNRRVEEIRVSLSFPLL